MGRDEAFDLVGVVAHGASADMDPGKFSLVGEPLNRADAHGEMVCDVSRSE